MLLVDPKSVISAHHPVHVKNGRQHQPSNTENPAKLPFGKAILKAVHGNSFYKAKRFRSSGPYLAQQSYRIVRPLETPRKPASRGLLSQPNADILPKT
jgi:hypothetical protein